MSANNNYYYSRLNKEQQKAYFAIKTGLEHLETSFLVPMLSGREFADIYFLIRMDHPEIFYSQKYKYRFYPNSDHVEMIPEYIYPKNKIIEHQKAMEARIKKLIRPAESLDEAGKQKFIHDFICENITYDKLKKPYSHEIIGPLGTGVGVCEGIAKSVKILADRLGLWNIIALCENNPDKGIKYRHTWNVFQFGGQYYHFDATYDNSLSKSGNLRYDYYNINDDKIFRDHEPVVFPIPACSDGKKFYYIEKKLSFTKKEDVQNRAKQAAKKGRPLIFHWRGGYLTREVLQELLEIIREEAAAKGKSAKVSLNWPQAVFFIQFFAQEEIAEESQEIIMEKADEDEAAAEETAGESAGREPADEEPVSRESAGDEVDSHDVRAGIVK